jgi:ATP-dependent protease ClpP protease subunit
MRQLHRLIQANRGRGSFRAEGNRLVIYDVIVASDADAAWLGGVSAETFQREIRAMGGDIELRINSPGGDVFAARAMAQAIREHPGKVTAYVDGVAASAASLLAVTAAETVMAPGSMMMIHEAWTIGLGNKGDFLATAALLEKIDASIVETYQAKAGGEPEAWAAAMAAETWYTAAEAVTAGLADRVSEAKPAAAQAAWDLGVYDNAAEAVNRVAAADWAEFSATNAGKTFTGLAKAPGEPQAEPQAEADPQFEHEHRKRRLAVRLLSPAA